MRDVRGVVHVAVRVPSLSAVQLDTFRGWSSGTTALSQIFCPQRISKSPTSFGRRVLNTLNALRLALDHIVTLEPLQNLAMTADPGSATANALLTMTLHRSQDQLAESHREWKVALREVEALTTVALRAVVARTRIALNHEHQGWSQTEERLERLGMAHADLERSLSEAAAETARLQSALDMATAESQEARSERDVAQDEQDVAQAERDAAQAKLAARPPAPPSDAVPKVDHDAEVAGLRNSLQALQVANVILQQDRDRLRGLADSQALVAYFVSMGVNGDGAAFQEHMQATYRHYESDVPEGLPKDDYEMGDGDDDVDDPQEEDAGDGDDDDDVEFLPGDGTQSPLRLSADGQRQVRPRVYTLQTNPKALFYRAMDEDAEPPRSDDDLSKLLLADADLSDVRLDVLELWRMDSDGCTLTGAEDVVLGATAEDIVVHANLRRDVLSEIIRRLLCLRSLDDVDWLKHVPEEYFDRAYKGTEETGWVVGVDRPWPPVPTEPHEASEPSDGDDVISDMEDEAPITPKKVRRRRLSLPRNAAPDFCHTDTADAISWFVNGVQVHPASQSGKHQIRGFPDYEDTMFRNREEVFWFACKEVYEECPSGFSDDLLILASEYVLLMFVHRRAQWERGHWVVFDRSSEAQEQVHLDRASRQRLWYKALTKLRLR
ncbi:hypothetical protein PHMEG_00020376 [Phytophthora megakarya]|uniref:Uncharacterized protein n=1 Tax=Phytophthora megakarya TaxID=4795 RepID=A0A225VP93_9STRA|nr:hypothetical protein PHMEG_00020376 [Phytophthora megakarya]